MAKKIWINFVQSLTNCNRSLMIHLCSNRSKLCHRFSIQSISKEITYLCTKASTTQCFSLQPASRCYLMMNPSSSVIENLFSPCFVEIQKGKFKLFSKKISIPISDRDTSLEEWVESSAHWNPSVEAATHTLDSNSLKLLVEGSFFPECSVLMSAAWIFLTMRFY